MTSVYSRECQQRSVRFEGLAESLPSLVSSPSRVIVSSKHPTFAPTIETLVVSPAVSPGEHLVHSQQCWERCAMRGRPPIELSWFHRRQTWTARAVRTFARMSGHHLGEVTQRLCLKIGHWRLLAHRLGWATRPTGSQEVRQRQYDFRRARRESLDWTLIDQAITMQKAHSPLSRHDLRICAWARIAK